MKPSSTGRSPWCLCLAILSSLLAPLGTFAQQPPGDAARQAISQQQQIQQRQQAESDRLQREQTASPRASGSSLEGAPEEEADPDAFKIHFHTIEIEGVTLLKPELVAGIRQKFVGKELGVADVNNILRLLTNAYIEKGWVTCRAYLPEQDITSGKLLVACVEGTLEDFTGDSGKKSLSVKTAFPGLKGKFLNLRDLEQGFDQLKRLPSNDATMEIEPGEEDGTSVVEISNPHSKRWRVIQSFDNHGFESSGEYQERTIYQHDHLLGLNDQWTLLYGQDPTGDDDGGFSRVASVGMSVPHGYWLFHLGADYFSYLSEYDLSGFPIESSGNNWNFRVGADYLYHRDQTSKSFLHFEMRGSIAENFINDVKLEGNSRQLTVAKIGASKQQPFAGGYLVSRLDYARGLPIFNAFDRDEDGISPFQPDGQFGVFSAELFYQRAVPLPLEKVLPAVWSSSLKVQYAPDNLFSTEQIGLGGPTSIRGFKDETVLSPSGLYWRNELALTVADWKAGTKGLLGKVDLYGAYDMGSTFGEYRIPQTDVLIHGAAFGLRATEGKLTADLSLGFPLGAPDFIVNRDPLFLAAFRITF